MTARAIVRRTYLDNQCVAALTRRPPAVAIQLIEQPFGERFDLVDQYLRALLEDPKSYLYTELRENEILSGVGYAIPESNRLVHYFLSDPKRATELGVYKAMGDSALAELDRLHFRAELDAYTLPLHDFRESARWRSPTFAALRMFDIMVLEGIRKRSIWHLWLFYLDSIAERMIRNYSPADPRLDLSSEWPTPYHYLLYTTVSELSGWIRTVADYPELSPPLLTRKVEHQNDNIPKSAILVLGSVVRAIVESPKFTADFKAYIVEIALRLVRDLRTRRRSRPYARVLLRSIVIGGLSGRYKDNSRYQGELKSAVRRTDTSLQLDLHGVLKRLRVEPYFGP